MENATDTLRNEVYPFKISVSLIQPGALDDVQPSSATSAASPQISSSRRQSTSVVGGAHKELYESISQTTRQIHSTIHASSTTTAVTPTRALHAQSPYTQALDHALFAPIPKIKYSVGWDTKFTRWIRWIATDRVIDLVFQSLVKQNLLQRQQNHPRNT